MSDPTPLVDALDFGDPDFGHAKLWRLARRLERDRARLKDALKNLDCALESHDRQVGDDDRVSVWVEWVQPARDAAYRALASLEEK